MRLALTSCLYSVSLTGSVQASHVVCITVVSNDQGRANGCIFPVVE